MSEYDHFKESEHEFLLYNSEMERYESYIIIMSWIQAYHYSCDAAEAYIKRHKILPCNHQNYPDTNFICYQ